MKIKIQNRRLYLLLLILCSPYYLSARPNPEECLLSKNVLLQKIPKNIHQSFLANSAKIIHNIVDLESTKGRFQGIVLNNEGYILSCYHAIQRKGEEVNVTFVDDWQGEAKVIGFDADLDISLLKIDNMREQRSKALLSSFDFNIECGTTKPGETIFAASQRKNEALQISSGHIKLLNCCDVFAGSFRRAMTIVNDCIVYAGDSGAPVFNLQGKLVGIINGGVLKEKAASFSGIAEIQKVLKHLIQGKTNPASKGKKQILVFLKNFPLYAQSNYDLVVNSISQDPTQKLSSALLNKFKTIRIDFSNLQLELHKQWGNKKQLSKAMRDEALKRTRIAIKNHIEKLAQQ